jgi:formylglycine-generating enzyme required for sulfatase activity
MGVRPLGDHEHRGMQDMHDARPVHRVSVRPFWMDRTPAANAQFARFVDATGYVTWPNGRHTPRTSRGCGRTS